MPTKTADDLRRAAKSIFEAVGTPPDGAERLADILVGSNLAGHDSHGIQHLPHYIKEAQAGEIVATANPEIVRETAGTALVTGRWGWGHLTADFVTRLGIKKARENGIALVSAVEVNHIGRLGEYVERAAEEEVVAIMVLGAFCEEKQSAAPYGGSKPLLLPNPIAIGFPTHDSHPVVLDFATTKVAGGKIMLAKAKGEQVPSGCIIDKDGNPSTDPEDFFDAGALLPFGEHKGFGIMVAAEILGRILSGADAYSDADQGCAGFRHSGVTLIALDSGAFSSSSQFAERTSELVSRIQEVPPAPGFSEVMAPVDFEQRARIRRLKQGIQIPDSTWAEVVQTAESLGVSV